MNPIPLPNTNYTNNTNNTNYTNSLLEKPPSKKQKIFESKKRKDMD